MTDSVLNPSNSTPSPAPQKQDSKRNTNLPKNILMGISAIALLGLGGLGVFTIAKERPELLGIKSEGVAKSEEDAEKELLSLVSEVGKIIELPGGESPTLATVTDLEQVKNQPFFTKAKNGDKVLVYAQAKKAILYRPSDKKIIEVGVVNMPSPTGIVAGQQTEEIQLLTPTPINTATPSPRTPLPPTETPLPTATPGV